MAEDKKKEKPSGWTSWNLDADEFVIVLIFLLALLGGVVPALLRLLATGEFTFYGFKISGLFDFFKNNIFWFKLAGFSLAGLGFVGTFIFNRLADAVWLAEKAKIYPQDMPAVSVGEPVKTEIQTKWEKIVKLSESENQSDWRLAIIEADIILSDLLDKLQLPGETMGDKLKAVEKSDFQTIDNAWEAHKFRNQIAHQGQDFLVNGREIRRVISLFESVFKEFDLI